MTKNISTSVNNTAINNTKFDDKIWSKILADYNKLQNKFIVIKYTDDKSNLRYNDKPVHFISEPDMKKNLKVTPNSSEEIVRVSGLIMLI